MKVFNEEKEDGRPGESFLLMLDKKEAKALIEMAAVAVEANKRKKSFLVY